MTLPEENNPYLRKFGFRGRSIDTEPDSRLGLVVVIPCFDEPGLMQRLECLWSCDRPDQSVEVIVVVNDSETAPPAAREQNAATIGELNAVGARWDEPAMRLRVIESLAQPRKHAGVGLSRKIGMDEAVRRFDSAGVAGEGILICYDADCRCDRNYLRAIEGHFKGNPATPGCSIYFEHPLDGAHAETNAAIAGYELHLRYYIDALRFAGFPGAFQTVGSSMAVRSWAYQKQGGMNRRQAGEDFYFLHRIIQLGGFTELNDTRVIPSPRASRRVPFGTGRAVGDLLASSSSSCETYPMQAFEDLRAWFALVARMRTLESSNELKEWEKLPRVLQGFLADQGALTEVAEMRAKTTNDETFRKRFFSWFNAFRVMKFVHHARDSAYGTQPVESAARSLLARSGLAQSAAAGSLRELLEVYRARDRSGWRGGLIVP